MRAILFVLLFPALCLANGMQRLHGYSDLYYDTDTMRRQGDRVAINVFWSNLDAPLDSTTSYTIIDCKTGAATTKEGIIKPDVQKALSQALCKKAWEIWK